MSECLLWVIVGASFVGLVLLVYRVFFETDTLLPPDEAPTAPTFHGSVPGMRASSRLTAADPVDFDYPSPSNQKNPTEASPQYPVAHEYLTHGNDDES